MLLLVVEMDRLHALSQCPVPNKPLLKIIVIKIYYYCACIRIKCNCILKCFIILLLLFR